MGYIGGCVEQSVNTMTTVRSDHAKPKRSHMLLNHVSNLPKLYTWLHYLIVIIVKTYLNTNLLDTIELIPISIAFIMASWVTLVNNLDFSSTSPINNVSFRSP